MTRALLTRKFKYELACAGFALRIDEGSLTATLHHEMLIGADISYQYVGKLKYSNQSVDYDALMQLIRSQGVDIGANEIVGSSRF